MLQEPHLDSTLGLPQKGPTRCAKKGWVFARTPKTALLLGDPSVFSTQGSSGKLSPVLLFLGVFVSLVFSSCDFACFFGTFSAICKVREILDVVEVFLDIFSIEQGKAGQEMGKAGQEMGGCLEGVCS